MPDESNNIDRCYGHGFKKLADCKSCEYADYCKDAADLPVSSYIQFDDAQNAAPSPSRRTEPEKTYTTSQMIELFRRMIYLDDERLRRIIQMKVENPACTLQEIGNIYGISKQAICSYIQKSVKIFPELKIILQNRPMFNKWRGSVVITYKKRKQT